MALPTTFGEFRVVGDPVLRFTKDGIAVANVRLVCNARRKDAQGGWEDDPDKVLWANASLWRKPAENLVNSVRDKDLVHVVGVFYNRDFEHNGVKRTSTEIDAVSISPSLTFRTTPHSDQQPMQQPPAQAQQPGPQPQGGWPNPQPQAPYGQPQGQPAYAQQGPQQGGGQQGQWPEQGWPGGGQQPPF
jgi:single stranded DNA-binding protein